MALAMVAPTPNSTPLGGTTTVGYKQSGGALWWTALPLPLVLHQPCAYLPPLVYLPSPPRPVAGFCFGYMCQLPCATYLQIFPKLLLKGVDSCISVLL